MYPLRLQSQAHRLRIYYLWDSNTSINMSLIQGSVAVLHNAKSFLTKLTAAEYSQKIDLMSQATIGQHTRHFIEFYQCLLAQAHTQNINYCLRIRDLQIEENPTVAIQAIDEVIANLKKLSPQDSISLYISKEGKEKIESTIARELHYNIEHCIHHLALIKIALKIIRPDLELSESFGVAPSTIQHRKKLAS